MMKIRTILLTVVCVICTLPAFAFRDGDFSYDENGSNCTLVDYLGSSGTVTIPSVATKTEIVNGNTFVTHYTVTSIGNIAFLNNKSLMSVTIPGSVTSIGWRAFYGCSSMTSVNISDGLTKIEDEAFYMCKSLTSINIPKGVTSIGIQAFYNCLSLTSVIIPDGVTSIENGVFNLCLNLTSVHIPDGVTSIGGVAFNYCTNLTSIIIPPGVTSIGEEAFQFCESLTSVTIPSSVTSIGKRAFRECFSLESAITIPYGVTSIEEYTFASCHNVPSITIPSSVKSIGKDAFNSCLSLKSVIIPESVTSIGDYAFGGCIGLTSITIPNSLTSIGGYGVFGNCSSLISVTIPSSVTSIGPDAFQDCSSLTSVTIPSSVEIIGIFAFSRCKSLESVTIPGSVTSLGQRSFEDCVRLTDMTVEWATPLSIPTNTFSGVSLGSSTLHVPSGTKALYEVATGWKNFGTIEDGTASVTGVSLNESSKTLNTGETFQLIATVMPSNATNKAVSWTSDKTDVATVDASGLVTAKSTGTATITVTTQEGNKTATCAITVVTPGTLTVSPPTLDFTASGETKSVTVTSNVSWTVDKNVSWITISQPSGSNNGTISITATANTTTSQRTETVTVTGGGITRTVSITQAAYVPPANTLTVSPPTLDFIASGETKSVTVTSNVSWTVDKNVSWISVSQPSGSNNGTINITATANTTTSQRTETVTVTGGGITRTVSITQAAYVPPANTLTVSPTMLDFTASGETKTIAVTSNVSWTAGKDTSWITVSPASGSNNGTISVAVEANTETNSRTGTVTVTGGGITRTVSITQAAYVPPTNTLTVSPATLDFTASGETKSVTVTSNVNWAASKDAAWITVSPASGSNNGTVSVTAEANTEISSRTGTVTISGGGLTHTIAVTQAADVTTPSPVLTVSTANVELAAEGGSQNITIQSNISWTAVCSDAWVSVSPASGTNNGTISITAVANSTENARTATVTVSGGGLTHTVTVKQAAVQQQIVADPEPPEGDQGTIDISLRLPTNEQFTITFTFRLPAGFRLNEEATSLIAELLANYELDITQESANVWRFVIRPKIAPRAASDMTYQQLLHIVYTMDETVGEGNYEIKLSDIDLTLNSGEVIHQDEITVPVTVSGPVGNAVIGVTDVRYYSSRLYVNTPVAERISVYSPAGVLMYQAQKQPGIATFNLNSLPKGVLIIRGSSGWARKVYRN
jgi:hypothetical protein